MLRFAWEENKIVEIKNIAMIIYNGRFKLSFFEQYNINITITAKIKKNK